jgi:hypothetical protein
MKHLISLTLGLVAWLVAPSPAEAQVGTAFPEDIEFKELAQTPAKSLEDFSGRLILIENFAYW